MKATLVLAALSAAVMSQAGVSILAGAGNFPGDENVQFNEGGLLQSGPLVQGVTNQAGFIVNFFNAGEDLQTPSAGQARVEAADGGYAALTIGLDNPAATFATFITDVNASYDGDLLIRVGYEDNGVAQTPYEETFTVDMAGSNWFRIAGTAGSRLNWIRLEAAGDIADIRQTRMGGAGVVPEPASMLGLAMGVGMLLKRRAKKS